MTKTFCDICDDLIPPSYKKYRVLVGETEHNEVCPHCYRSLNSHIESMKVKAAQAPEAP